MIQNLSSRFKALGLSVCFSIFSLAASTSLAQDWPSRPVKVIVPFATGGSADVFGRIIAQRLQEALGQGFVVENRPGAGAIIGTDAVAKAAPDGYTLLVMSNTHTVNESLIANKPFQLLRDFAPVAPINYSDLVLVTRPNLGANSLQDLLRMARSKPGGLTYASSGPGTPYHMAGELLNHLAGVRILHVPYKGSSEARTGVMSGQVEIMIDAITTMTPQIKANRVRGIGVASDKRVTLLPDVPTLTEQGFPDTYADNWYGMLAPAKTPPAILARLNSVVAGALNDPSVKQKLVDSGAIPAPTTQAEFGNLLKEELARWTKIVREKGIKEPG